MATLQKIRNHGVILLVIVGLAMLAFILGDFLNSGSSFFNRSREYVGTIQGHKVHYTDYEAAKDQLTDFYKIESGNSNLDEETSTAIRNQVWESMRWDWTLRAEGKKIGMTISDDELTELTKSQHPHQIIAARRMFMGNDGQFNYEQLNNFLTYINQEEDNDERGQAAEMKDMYREYWRYCVYVTRLNRMQEKYTSLVQSLFTANNIDAKYQFKAGQTSVSALYVMQPYSAVADSTITVSENDIKKLYNQRKKLYKQEPNRSLEYISFAVVPSEEDFRNTETMLQSLEEEFKTSEEVALIVNNANSNYRYTAFNYSVNTIPAAFKDFAFGPQAKKDAFMPLNLDGNTYRMARIMECGYSLPDSVKLRPVIKNDSAQVEEQEAVWYTEAMLTPEIATKAFTAKAGSQFTVSQGMGELTIECVEVSAATPKVKIAMIENTVTASSKTTSVLYNQAKQFIVSNPDEVKFREAVEKEGMRLYPAYNMTKNQDKVGQLKQSREIVRWAFGAEEGAVSDVFDCGDQFVVALLSEVSDGEYRSLSEVEGELRAMATRNAKAKVMIDNLAKAQSLDEAAQIANTTVDTVESVRLSDTGFGKFGMEPAAVGGAFATEAGQLSTPVKGEQGVYVLVPGQQMVAEGEEEDDAAIIQRMNMQNAYYLPYRIMPLLLEQAKIEDNRSNFQ